MKLEGKVVLITDGDSPLGLALAEGFRAEGAILALNVHNPDGKAIDAQAPVNLAKIRGEPDMLTFANPVIKKEVDDAVSSVLARYGRIDVLIHNNNEVFPTALESCDDDSFDRAMGANLKSAFLFAQAVGAAMKEAGKGNIIFLGSIHDEKPSGAAFAYSLARGAIKMLAKEMTIDLGPYNIRTNIVSIGPVEGHDEDFYSALSPLYENVKGRIVNEKYCDLSEAAKAAIFFAGDDCPSANGAELKIDGGFLMTYYTAWKRPGKGGENDGH